MKTVCLYYSRTGKTKSIMERIAMLLDADLFEYTDGKDRSGAKGYLASCVDCFKPLPQVSIVGAEPEWEKYDRVIVGMPLWSEMPCIVGKAFLKEHGKETHFGLHHDRGTGYGAYTRIQTLLKQVYEEVRDEKAQEVYGKRLQDLSADERSQINFMVPLSISEAETI